MTWSRHPNLATLQAFAAGELTDAEHQRITDHLFGGCVECASVLVEAGSRAGTGCEGPTAGPESSLSSLRPWQITDPDLLDADDGELSPYEETFDRLFTQVGGLHRLLTSERHAAPELLAALWRHPMRRRLLLVRNADRFHSAGLCELLLAESWQRRFHDRGSTRECAELAVAVAEMLDPSAYGLRFVEDLRARAWAYLGNALRLWEELRAAEEAFARAESLREAGSGAALDKAQLLSFQASLRSHQGRFEEAEVLLGEAVQIYEDERDPHRLGLAFINKASVRGHLGDLEGAVDLLRRGVPLVDHEEEPRALLVAVHNLAYFLNQFGRSREALMVLVQWRFVYLKAEDRNVLLRLYWLEGAIAMGLGRFDQAEGSLKEAQRGFIEQEKGFDAALVSLDLAVLHLRQGRTAEVRELVHDMLPIFRIQEVHREAAAALIIFCQAVKRERVTLELATEVADFLNQARNDPALRFETVLDL